jgi:hypothetical protein
LLVGRLVDQQLSVVCNLHEAGSEVHGVADHCVLAPRLCAHLAAVGGSCAESRAVRAARQAQQLEGAADRSLLVVLVADGRAEEGHEDVAAVADRQMTEMPAVCRDQTDSGGQVALQGGHRIPVVDRHMR